MCLKTIALCVGRAFRPLPVHAEEARIHTVSFPEARFLVGEVRLEFDNFAVPLWNEIDAVGIGRCGRIASTVDAPVVDEVPAATGIDGVRPNPFTVSTALSFALAGAGHVKVEVFDVTGQRVAQVMNRMLPPGRHDARWDGRASNGRSVASGIYYLRVESAGLNGTRKIVKVE